MEQNLSISVYFPDIPELNPKYLRCVKAHVLSIMIHSSDGEIKPGGIVGALNNNRLMPASVLSFTVLHLMFFTTYTDLCFYADWLLVLRSKFQQKKLR